MSQPTTSTSSLSLPRTFRVGAVDYTVSVTPGPLLWQGEPIGGGTIQPSREILLSADTDGIERLRVMLRELARAWNFEIGTPDDRDGWHDLAATVAMAALRDLLPAETWATLASGTPAAGEAEGVNLG